MTMQRLCLTLVCAAAVSGLGVSHVDLLRAHTARPSSDSPLLAGTKDEVFLAINAFMKTGGWRAKPCEEFSLSELEAVEAQVVHHAAEELNVLYTAKKDRRTLLPAVRLPRHATHSAQYNATRDGHCAYVLMQWAHHIPTEARALLEAARTVLPLMPSAGPLSSPDATYEAKVSCTSCHYQDGKLGETVQQTEQKHEVEVEGPQAPRWGGNATTMWFSSSVTMTDDATLPTWEFDYYFDAVLKASVWDHKAGQRDALCKEQPEGIPCKVIFASDGNAYAKTEKQCCKNELWSPWGAVRSEWLFTNTSYVGTSVVNNITVDQWFKQGLYDNHYYATNDSARIPVRFMEHVNGILKSWDFHVPTYNTTRLPASFFAQPEDCHVPCQ